MPAPRKVINWPVLAVYSLLLFGLLLVSRCSDTRHIRSQAQTAALSVTAE